ncbi:MAG: HIT family protein [Candidatus Latescibacteria bacterium]|nr:HIT family protein [Candidatus Latescibacterota bacterium]
MVVYFVPQEKKEAFLYNHAPEGYICPFCLLVQSIESDHLITLPADIIYQDDHVMAFIGSHQWPNNRGHVIVIPAEHHENIYDLPLGLATKIHELARAVALAMKGAYGCEGISTRQHNEPGGYQEVWHYHLHVFPRYAGDHLYGSERARMPAEERAGYARKLRAELSDWKPVT